MAEDEKKPEAAAPKKELSLNTIGKAPEGTKHYVSSDAILEVLVACEEALSRDLLGAQKALAKEHAAAAKTTAIAPDGSARHVDAHELFPHLKLARAAISELGALQGALASAVDGFGRYSAHVSRVLDAKKAVKS
jgi:hypothetical protein